MNSQKFSFFNYKAANIWIENVFKKVQYVVYINYESKIWQ